MTKYEKKILPIFVIDRFGMSLFLLLKISLFILFLPLIGHTQNLVPNGSFEEYDLCPETMDLSGYVSNWYNVLNSCDYFNECSQIVGVPDNPISYQMAFEGFGYCGFHTFFLNDPEYREILGIKLTENLQVATEYYFSFRLNKADKSENIKATNNVGIKFSMDSIQTEAEMIDNTAHFKIDSICYDAENWNLITGSFIADLEYKYLFIGNFFNDTNTLTDGPGTVWDRNGYYNIEDVRVSSNQDFAWAVNIEEKSTMPLIRYSLETQILTFINLNRLSQISIYDVSGKQLINTLLDYDLNYINVSNLQQGIYIVLYLDEKNNYTILKFTKI